MTKPTNVCLDTNILFRILTQGQPGCEWALWGELKQLVIDKKVSFLIPEVITLELDKLTKRWADDFDIELKLIETYLTADLKALFVPKKNKEKGFWNELEDIAPFIQSQFNEWKKQKLDGFNHRKSEVVDFLAGTGVVKLPFTQEIFFKANRRILAGNFPKKESRPIDDCSIIETLVSYFEGRCDSEQLVICTENLPDFGVSTDGVNALHPLLKSGLPPTEVFTDLESLVKFLREQKPVVEPPQEELEKALESEKKRDEQEVLTKAFERELEEVFPYRHLFQKTPSISHLFNPEVVAAVKDAQKISERAMALDELKSLGYSKKLVEEALWGANHSPTIAAALKANQSSTIAAALKADAERASILREQTDKVNAALSELDKFRSSIEQAERILQQAVKLQQAGLE